MPVRSRWVNATGPVPDLDGFGAVAAEIVPANWASPWRSLQSSDYQMWATAVQAGVCILALSDQAPVLVKFAAELLAQIRCLECGIR